VANKSTFTCHVWTPQKVVEPGAAAEFGLSEKPTHYQALRTLANRLVGILHGCLRTHTTGCPRSDVARVNALAIPPAWTDVWICRVPNGHLQAVGIDDAGRSAPLPPGLAGPAGRAQVRPGHPCGRAATGDACRRARGPRRRGDDPRQGVCRGRSAARPRLLPDRSDSYANGDSFGSPRSNAATYVAPVRRWSSSSPASPGSSTTSRSTTSRAARRLSRCVGAGRHGPPARVQERRSLDRPRCRHRERLPARGPGEDLTAKDFRTWHATVLAAAALAESDEPGTSKASRRRAVKAALAEVADFLGNSPAIARSSYVDPRVFDLYEDGVTIAAAGRQTAPRPRSPAGGAGASRAPTTG
jgi:DNA topoisomerase-1